MFCGILSHLVFVVLLQWPQMSEHQTSAEIFEMPEVLFHSQKVCDIATLDLLFSKWFSQFLFFTLQTSNHGRVLSFVSVPPQAPSKNLYVDSLAWPPSKSSTKRIGTVPCASLAGPCLRSSALCISPYTSSYPAQESWTKDCIRTVSWKLCQWFKQGWRWWTLVDRNQVIQSKILAAVGEMQRLQDSKSQNCQRSANCTRHKIWL